jgi:hypothetical protein
MEARLLCDMACASHVLDKQACDVGWSLVVEQWSTPEFGG